MNTEYVSHINCTQEEKILCMDTVNLMLSLVQIARCEGLLALERMALREEYASFSLMHIGIDLLTDGMDPHIVESILENYIITSKLTDKEFMDNMLIFYGMLAIQQGENPSHIEERLASLFGLAFREEFFKRVKREEWKENSSDCDPWLQMDQKLSDFDKTNTLDFVPKQLDHASIERLLREISLFSLECAMLGSKQPVVERFYACLSKHNQQQFCDDICHFSTDRIEKKTIERAQKEIAAVANKLQERGEIVPFPITVS